MSNRLNTFTPSTASIFTLSYAEFQTSEFNIVLPGDRKADMDGALPHKVIFELFDQQRRRRFKESLPVRIKWQLQLVLPRYTQVVECGTA